MRSLNRGSFRASPTHKFKLDRALVFYESIFQRMIEIGEVELAKLFLETKKINLNSNRLNSFIMQSMDKGNKEMFTLFLKHGADLFYPSYNSCFSKVVENNNTEFLRLILETKKFDSLEIRKMEREINTDGSPALKDEWKLFKSRS